MLVKLKESFVFVHPAPTTMVRGSVVDMPTATANEWVDAGLASRIPVVETASKPDYETTVARNRKGK